MGEELFDYMGYVPPNPPPGVLPDKLKPDTSYGLIFERRPLTWRHYAAVWIIADGIALVAVLLRLSQVNF